MMLLDTHVALWLLLQPQKLSRPAASAIRKARQTGNMALASISFWEIALLFQQGRVRASGTVEAAIQAVVDVGFHVVPITAEIASLSTQFSIDYPNDPADRLIGATARAEGMTLITRDQRIRECPLLKTLW